HPADDPGDRCGRKRVLKGTHDCDRVRDVADRRESEHTDAIGVTLGMRRHIGLAASQNRGTVGALSRATRNLSMPVQHLHTSTGVALYDSDEVSENQLAD